MGRSLEGEEVFQRLMSADSIRPRLVSRIVARESSAQIHGILIGQIETVLDQIELTLASL